MPTPVDPFLTEADVAAVEDRDLLGLLAEESALLAATLDVARSVQWTAARPAERTVGQPANPTAETVVDRERLALRLKVIEGERALRETLSRVAQARRDLLAALAPYGGDTPRETPVHATDHPSA